MAAGRKHGSGGEIRMDPTGGATAAAVGDLNAWTLDMARDQVDVSAFGDSNKQYVLGLPDVKGTYGGWWNSASSPDLFVVAQGKTPVLLELVPAVDDNTFFFTGPAYLDASINVSATGAVSISGNFVAAGDWGLEGPTTPLASGAVIEAAAAARETAAGHRAR
jgi:hypothetical protein